MNIFRKSIAGFFLLALAAPALSDTSKSASMDTLPLNPEFERQLHEAWKLHDLGKYAEAEAVVNAIRDGATLNDRELYSLWCEYGVLNEDQEKFTEALSYYEKASKLPGQPDGFRAWILEAQGSVYKKQKEDKLALQAFRNAEALRDGQMQPAVLADMGELESRAGNDRKAFDYYKRAVSDNGVTPEKKWLQYYDTLAQKLKMTDDHVDALRLMVFLYQDENSVAALQKYSGGIEPAPQESASGKRETNKPGMRQEIYKVLSAVQKKAESKDYRAARSKVEDVLVTMHPDSYERAYSWNLMGYLYAHQEQYLLALYAYEQLRRNEDLPEDLLKKTTLTEATLYAKTKRFETAIERAKQHIGLGGNYFHATNVICSSYALLKKYEQAIASCKELLATAEKQSMLPPEDTLKTLYATYYQSGDRKNELLTLKNLLKLYPRPAYEKRLAELEANAKKSPAP